MAWFSRNRPLLRRLLLGAAGLVLLVAAGGFLVAPPLVKSQLEKRLSAALKREVRVDAVRVNPFTTTLRVRGLEVKERSGPSALFAFDALRVRFGAFRSLFAWAPVVSSVDLEGPRLNLVRNADGTYNVSDLLRPEAPRGAAAPPLRYSVNNIRITGGRVDFDDRPMKAKHQVTDLRVGIPFLSNLPSQVEIDTEPSFSAVVNGRPFEVHGTARPFSARPEMVLEVAVDGLEIPRYLPYLPADLGVAVPSGRCGMKGTLTFRERKDGARALVLAGRFFVDNLALDERDGVALARFPRIEAEVLAADLLRGEASLRQIVFHSPDVTLSRRAGGRWNFDPLLPATGPPDASAPPSFHASIGHIQVLEGTLRWDDRGTSPPVRMVLHPLALQLFSFDSALSTPVGVQLSLATDTGATLEDDGTLTPSPLAAEGLLRVTGLPLAPLAPYLDPLSPLRIGGGALSASSRYVLRSEGPALSGTLTELTGSLADFSARLPRGEGPLLRLGMASWSGSSADLGSRKVRLGELAVDRARLGLVRGPDGVVDVVGAFAPAPPPEAGAPERRESPAWQVSVDRLLLDRSAVAFEDRGPRSPATLSLALSHAEGRALSTEPGSRGDLSLRGSLNDRGTLEARGPLGLSPLALDWTVRAQGLPLLPFEPYFSDLLEIQVTGGTASAKGRLALEMPDAGGAEGTFAGDLEISDFASVDKAQQQDFLNWKSLRLGTARVQLTPPGATLQEVALSGFYSRLIVNPEGKLNLAQIVSANEPDSPDASPAEPWDQPDESLEKAPPPKPVPGEGSAQPETAPFDLSIASVILADGHIDYTDHFIQPNYSANMTEVAGRISGLSSDPSTRADLEIRARLDHQAPIEVLGRINPLAKSLFLDLSGKATDIELSPLSPYSGRFAGYIIEKGKLNVEVTYHVEDGRLDAENHIFLDQFTLGERVESPNATKLPVKLAVALLKDRQGRIDLTLPVSGSLHDPRFKIGRVILKIFVNLIAKAVTSPFALLGRMFGGKGEALSFIEYEPGRATLDASAIVKVEQLTKALVDRPGLRLDIAGRSDPGTDREGLKRVFLEQRVQAEKRRELGKAAETSEGLAVGAEEYPDLLFKAYKRMKFPKPRTLVGTAKELPVQEMERLMLANLEVTDADLRQLAQARAQVVKDALCAAGGVDANRVFLVADTEPSAEVSGAKPGRAELNLK